MSPRGIPRTVAAILVLLFALPLSGSAQPNTRTQVTGFGPYILGADATGDALTDLAPGRGEGSAGWTAKLRTDLYHKSGQFPIGGEMYSATLVVEMWQGKIASVIIRWSAGTFQSTDLWRVRTADLVAQIKATYPTLRVGNDVSITSGLDRGNRVFELFDADGNAVMVLAFRSWLDLVYLWGPFYRASQWPAPPAPY